MNIVLLLKQSVFDEQFLGVFAEQHDIIGSIKKKKTREGL